MYLKLIQIKRVRFILRSFNYLLFFHFKWITVQSWLLFNASLFNIVNLINSSFNIHSICDYIIYFQRSILCP